MPFSTFIGYCKDLLKGSISQSRKHENFGLTAQHGDNALGEESPHQIYLAQVASHDPTSLVITMLKLDCAAQIHAYLRVVRMG